MIFKTIVCLIYHSWECSESFVTCIRICLISEVKQSSVFLPTTGLSMKYERLFIYFYDYYFSVCYIIYEWIFIVQSWFLLFGAVIFEFISLILCFFLSLNPFTAELKQILHWPYGSHEKMDWRLHDIAHDFGLLGSAITQHCNILYISCLIIHILFYTMHYSV